MYNVKHFSSEIRLIFATFITNDCSECLKFFRCLVFVFEKCGLKWALKPIVDRKVTKNSINNTFREWISDGREPTEYDTLGRLIVSSASERSGTSGQSTGIQIEIWWMTSDIRAKTRNDLQHNTNSGEIDMRSENMSDSCERSLPYGFPPCPLVFAFTALMSLICSKSEWKAKRIRSKTAYEECLSQTEIPLISRFVSIACRLTPRSASISCSQC